MTAAALRRWLPILVRRAPHLGTAYLVPGRVHPRLREATMLGVTSVNRCRACEAVHRRWARSVGLATAVPAALSTSEAAAFAYGQAVATDGPWAATPGFFSRRHGRELRAAATVMQVANLVGNRYLGDTDESPLRQVGGWCGVRLYDLGMLIADRLGLRRARARIAGGARGDVLEIGIGTGRNLSAYPVRSVVHGIDPNERALRRSRRRARALGRVVGLVVGEAEVLPYPDDSFDVIVGTLVLCSVGDVGAALRETRRVLRPGGTVRFLEHARADTRPVARFQRRLAPAWAAVAGGCRLDHDVRRAITDAGYRVIAQRSHAGGVVIELVAIDAQSFTGPDAARERLDGPAA